MKQTYVGSTISRDDSWLLELAHIPESMRLDEPALQRTRWFDQRAMLPAQATYFFAARYEQIYRDKFAHLTDYRDAQNVRALSHADIFKGPDLNAMWRARQGADRIGCKYDFYLNFACNRCLDRGWKYLPRPNQLYGDELVLDASDAWEAHKRASLQLATDPRFLVENYSGHPDQDAYHDYLIEQVKQRAQPHLTLARLVYREKMLPAELAGKHFGPSALKSAFIHYQT